MKAVNQLIEARPGRISSQFWKADWHLSFLLGLLVLVVFVLYPMGGLSPFVGILLQAFFSLIMITGVAMVATNRTVLALASLFAAGTAAFGWIRLYTPSGWLVVTGISMWILFLAMLVGVILTRVFGEGKITLHRVRGSIAAYLLLGVIWSGGYRLVIHLAPEAFNLPAVTDEGTLMSKLVYFSFVTLTTVGYGDITAVHPAARSLAMLEAFTGQLFPAVLIARLVSLEVSNRESK